MTIEPSNAADDTSLASNVAPESLNSEGGESRPEESKMEESAPAEVKKRIPLASIPAIISIGLLIALLYLGGRIITAHRPAKAVAVQSAPVAVKPVEVKAVEVKTLEVKPPAMSEAAKPAPGAVDASNAPVAKPVIPEPVADQEPLDSSALPMITPQAGQHFIQVGALDLSAEATRRFVGRLRGEKLDPHVAPGPTPTLMRVLLGPFDSADVLNAKKAQLDAEGLDSFVRKY